MFYFLLDVILIFNKVILSKMVNINYNYII
ncbi:hypothetical protein L1275_000050 [Flavobacterium sp. HSC-61S13]|nr:hypothetical protein [Flavobacterium sp. HSC-61S13]